MFNGMSKKLECEKHYIELGIKQLQEMAAIVEEINQNKGFSIHTKNVVEWLEKSLEIIEFQNERVKQLERENTLMKAAIEVYEQRI